MGDKYGPKTPGLIRAYGCCKCQREHREGVDAEFADHSTFQSKHGVYERVPADKGEEFAAEFERITAAE
jgi:hypothetical protein